MNYSTIYHSRESLNFEFENKYTLGKITEFLLAAINTDCLVNYGCNLKWKLTGKNKFRLMVGNNCCTKQASKPLI